MKKLILAAAFLFLLTSCTTDAAVDDKDKDVSKLETKVEQLLQEEISDLETDDFFNEQEKFQLKQNGITPKVSDIKLADEGNFNFILELDNGSKSASFDLTAKLSYQYFEENEEIACPNFLWGRICFLDDETFLLTNVNKIYHYDTNKMKALKGTPKTDELSDLVFLSSVENDEKEILTLYTAQDGSGVLTFDKSGKMKNNVRLSNSLPSNEDSYYGTEFIPQTFQDTYFYSNKRYYNDYYMNYNSVEGKPYILFYSQGTGRLHTINLTDNTVCAPGVSKKITNGDYTILITIAINPNTGLRGDYYTVLLYENDKLLGMMNFFLDGLNTAPFNSDTDSLKFTFDKETQKLTFKCDETYLTLIVDYKNRSADYSYDIPTQALENKITSSKDGNYSLYSASYHGAGDVGLQSVVVHNNKTDENTFLSQSGGMYGGNSDCGFFSNGDAYVSDPYSFKIFYKSENFKNKPFNLNKNFKLGRDENGAQFLFATRRDPEDFSFIICYMETKSSELAVISDLELKDKYRIGFCDKEGNLIESYEIDENVKFNAFGFNPVYMYLKGNELKISAKIKDTKIFEGTFDMTTHKYKRTYKW